MDVQKKLDDIVEAVGSARSMPMSASCVVNRAELLAMLEEVRQALPGSLAQARELIGGREQMVEEARREAERIIAAAHAERGSLISDSEVTRRSREEADRILREARREAEEIRAEADDYVDSKLANFEVVLTKTIGSVDRGREKLLGRGPGLDAQGYADGDAPEYSADPQTLVRRADEYVDAKLSAFEAVLGKTLEAVGRGRQKLHGRTTADALGEHMAAQDAAGPQQPHTSDADYLAGLAEPAEPPPAAAVPAQAPPAREPDPYGYPAQQPQEAYAYQQDPYAYHQQAYDQGGYAQGYAQPDQYAYQQPQGAPHAPQVPHQQAALDETSFFDTGMIDLEQLRRYEQGHGQGH
ncbi:cell division initiation protein [Streptomyces somaliensis DSM 40738]|uniref:Cell division initiation protein n=1 Tax=Streptomyces somaliensis (strain ATCC 33201 / DSM 40738 / JCM 12659 / KCTC 9044 / NCTC 11332 / NRRL B-12077 / IP 733) TaxID=1134445 RepID=A0AA44ICH1_STRE0|nr:cell division initiation protein [Streptomyces somaliensis]MCQ0023510.1 cell division initiation protein [Streptomyces somaliensis DSM 40738]NKY13675.1 cell division initiation protein [Streptomyces somaliensis DSM 40738]